MGEGLSPPSQKRAFDHDLMSIADPQQKDYWVGLDLEQPCRLDNWYTIRAMMITLL